MNQIEQALKIAIMAHEGQKDLDGKPTIIRPITIGFAGKTEAEIVVGILFNILDQPNITTSYLEKNNFPPYIIHAIEILSHKQGIEERAYVNRIKDSGNPLAIRVAITMYSQALNECKLNNKECEDEIKHYLRILTMWLPKRFTCKNCFNRLPKLKGQKHCLAFLFNSIPQELLDGAEHLFPWEGQDEKDMCFTPLPPPMDLNV